MEQRNCKNCGSADESVFLKNLRDDLKPFADSSDCCTFIVRLRKENKEQKEEIDRLNNIIDELEKEFRLEIKRTEDIRENQYCLGRYDSALDNLDKLIELKEGK